MIFFILFVIFLFWCLLRITDTKNDCNACLVGKTALVTGGNKGLGFQTSLGLASRGCRVIIACRSNAEEASNEILRLTNNPNIILKKLDLSSFNSIRTFADDLNKTEQKIDILINNAGIANVSLDKNLTKDGFIFINQVNYLGPFLLTHLLINLLKKSSEARILWLSSITVWWSNLKLKTMKETKLNFNSIPLIQYYPNTKAAIATISNVFAEKLKPCNITSNALHPGACYTNIFDAADEHVPKFVMWIMYGFGKILFKSAEAGAQLTLKMAMSRVMKNKTGKFLWDFNEMPHSSLLRDKKFQDDLWRESEKWVNLKEEEKI